MSGAENHVPNLDALEEYRSAIRDTTRLNRLFAILSDRAPIAVVADKAVIALSEMFAADVVALLQADSGELGALGAIGLPDELGGRRFTQAEGSCVSIAVATGAPVVASAARDDPRIDPILKELEIETVAVLPVLGSSEVLGVLVVCRGQPVPFSRGDIDLMLAMTHRIGLVLERNRAEEEQARLDYRLRQAEKAESLARMAGAIAHHMNNKLTGVLGYLELGLVEVDAGRDPRQEIAEAQSAARQASDVGRQMLAYLGQGLNRHESLDLGALCRKTIDDLRERFPAHQDIRLEMPAGTLPIRGSRRDIEQLLTNLIVNAQEATASGGDITIEVSAIPATLVPASPLLYRGRRPVSGRYACVEVSDTGSGMTTAVLENAFDPFFSTKFAGRGLGLSVVLGVLRAHDGTIAVTSGPGRGSTFRIFLPLAET